MYTHLRINFCFDHLIFYRWSWPTTYIKSFAPYPMFASMVLHLRMVLIAQHCVLSMWRVSTLLTLQLLLINRFETFRFFGGIWTVNVMACLKWIIFCCCCCCSFSSMGWLLDRGITVHSFCIDILVYKQVLVLAFISITLKKMWMILSVHSMTQFHSTLPSNNFESPPPPPLFFVVFVMICCVLLTIYGPYRYFPAHPTKQFFVLFLHQ